MTLARELDDAGQYLIASPLHPAATATCVRVRDGKREVTDGPFTETTEVLAGFTWSTPRTVSRPPCRRPDPGVRFGSVEVRALFDPSSVWKSATIS